MGTTVGAPRLPWPSNRRRIVRELPGLDPGLFGFVRMRVPRGSAAAGPPEEVVETRRLELLTPSLQRRCSTN